MSDLRMPDVNKVFLAGRLTADPDLRYTPAGVAVCKLRLAITRVYRAKDGERKEETAFVNVSTWDKSAEFCSENLRKGRPVFVEGRLRSSEWEDRTSGQKRTSLEIHAQRVQMMDWETPGAAAQPKPEPTEVAEPLSEDDTPF
jgi:single-strand DNA-binding protein